MLDSTVIQNQTDELKILKYKVSGPLSKNYLSDLRLNRKVIGLVTR